ncbi:MAG: efflux RND transporter periplasmic adaptor subunit [Armatimonadetes bacterium]|nr:efflux RND transporter periplasmic adaptor subunit [Armatimonadota bacterium]
MSRNRIIAIVLIIFVMVGLFAMGKVRQVRKVTKTTEQIHEEMGVPVQTAEVTVGPIEDTVSVTGDLAALKSVTLSSKIPGKVTQVTVREGDPVSRGQVVVELDRTDASANLMQAQAGLQAANARLSQAKTSAAVTDVQSEAAIKQAKAALVAAQANLEKIRKGARSQERMIAENQVTTAKANLDNAEANLRRYKQLYEQGAVPQAQLDVYQTQYDVALAQYNSAKENLSLVEEGARREDVRAAETQVTQAEEALRTAKANAAQTDLRREDIKNARAGVAQAQAQVAIAREQLDNTIIRSPIDGIVSARMTEPGQTVSPGVPLGEAVNLGTVYFEANISETVLAKVKVGDVVNVKVDAFPGQSFIGKVQRIYPAASTNTRTFSARISVPNPESSLKPGMFARGSIISASRGSAILVPQNAVEERSGEYVVFKLEGQTAKMHTVTRGLSNPEFVELLPPTEVGPGDTVITAGHEYLEDGTKVHVGAGK